MSRVLLLATTTGYQTRAFGDAAVRLGLDLVFATDRCHALDDPWRDGAIPVRFHEEDASVDAILRAARERPLRGILAVGDRPVVLAARAAAALDLPWHPPAAAAAASNKHLTRARLAAAGLPVAPHVIVPLDGEIETLLDVVPLPCVVKPLALSGSRGVIRADTTAGLAAAVARVRALLASPEVRAMRDPANQFVAVQQFIPGREFALEGVMEDGRLHTLALFDKPDPLDGPFFEETIYLTPSREPAARQAAIVQAIAEAAAALGLRHGPVHAECRVNDKGIFVLETAARPIGGLCARVLRLVPGAGEAVAPASLEELLLRQAAGESVEGWRLAPGASGVMMIPIPAAGVYRGVDGVEDARAVPGIADLIVTARPEQRLVPLPEGGSYLGFIFAHGVHPADVEASLRQAHARLRVRVDTRTPVADLP